MPAHFHHVPGRLRVHVPGIKGNSLRAQAIENYLSQFKGVSRVEGRPLTGSVVVHYDANTLDSRTLFSALNIRTDIRALPSKHSPASPNHSGRIAAKAAKAVAGYALEKAVERGIPLLLRALL